MVVCDIRRPPDECYASFSDSAQVRLWLPGLKKLRVVAADERGRLREAAFEIGEALSFALVYAYDDRARRVRWVPSAGVRDGVSGFASFEPTATGTRFSYSLDSLRGREPDHERHVAEAFAAWMHGR